MSLALRRTLYVLAIAGVAVVGTHLSARAEEEQGPCKRCNQQGVCFAGYLSGSTDCLCAGGCAVV